MLQYPCPLHAFCARPKTLGPKVQISLEPTLRHQEPRMLHHATQLLILHSFALHHILETCVDGQGGLNSRQNWLRRYSSRLTRLQPKIVKKQLCPSACVYVHIYIYTCVDKNYRFRQKDRQTLCGFPSCKYGSKPSYTGPTSQPLLRVKFLTPALQKL